MTNDEIQLAIFEVRENRRKEQKKRMEEYDKEIYLPEINRLIELCSHSKLGAVENNGIGVYWRACVFCGKTFLEER